MFFALSADAQWWKKKTVVRLPLLESAKRLSFNFNKTQKTAVTIISDNVKFELSQFGYEIAEAAIMKSLYHTLRFHMYSESIDNFNILIGLYMGQQRYSEAKWYFLQINNLARQKGDDTNIIASLVGLGMVKSEIGDFAQAKDDLNAAVDFAAGRGRLNDVGEIRKKLAIVEHKRSLNIKSDIKYAELLPEDKKN
ncbi:hypothetical protein BEL04_22695 [Mucilaginibacter sp. PPCGB 2223]|nr:hypothetical protein BEL04_22695 [Mucilaginibacter sp. PPCGB 2223]